MQYRENETLRAKLQNNRAKPCGWHDRAVEMQENFRPILQGGSLLANRQEVFD